MGKSNSMNEIIDCNKRVMSSLRQITHSIDRYSRRLRTESGITVPQLICLICIAENGKLTTSAIANKIHVANSTIIGILDRLEVKKYILRQRDTVDRRKVFVSATPQGKKLIEFAPSPLQDKLSESLKNLPQLEQTAIALSLEKVVDLMGVEDISPAPILATGQLTDSA